MAAFRGKFNAEGGRFIAFEGIDGSGKTTQAAMLCNHLGRIGLPSVLTREPTGGRYGKLAKNMIVQKREFDSAHLQELFAADRMQHLKRFILPMLADGFIVVADRYKLSSMAYGIASGLDAEWLAKLNSRAPEPFLTVMLDIPPKTAMGRIEKRGVENTAFEKKEFLGRVRKAYLSLAAGRSDVLIMDGSGSRDEIGRKVARAVVKKYTGRNLKRG
ncbi:MAG: dTMP kinase [Nitrososphaerota archaeon]|jgi:dTMP kinase|nr:dTMP kinase [Nitrososphaerota archaeon]